MKKILIIGASKNLGSYLVKKFSKNWWLRRREAHEYMVYLFKKNKIQYKNFDYTLTKIINFFYFKL